MDGERMVELDSTKEYDPTKHSGEVVPAVDPADMKRCPHPNDGPVWWRLSRYNAAVQNKGMYGDLSRFRSPEARDALIHSFHLFATFPFRILSVQDDGVYQVETTGLREAIEDLKF